MFTYTDDSWTCKLNSLHTQIYLSIYLSKILTMSVSAYVFAVSVYIYIYIYIYICMYEYENGMKIH